MTEKSQRLKDLQRFYAILDNLRDTVTGVRLLSECTGYMNPKVTDEDTGETKESLSGWHFCRICGSALWVWDSRWPELVHPSASAIDTDLPTPPERVHLMVGSKASWVNIREDRNDKIFETFPDESIEEWHKRLGLEDREN